MVLCSSNNNGTLNVAAVTLRPVQGALRETLFSTLLKLEHLHRYKLR
jgi:16S rRNA G966 N2-methylase RsmD